MFNRSDCRIAEMSGGGNQIRFQSILFPWIQDFFLLPQFFCFRCYFLAVPERIQDLDLHITIVNFGVVF